MIALALLGLVFAVTSWIVEGVTPSWIVFPTLLLVGLVRARRGGSSGTVWLGVSALVFLLVHLPFDKAALSDHCVNPGNSDKACHPAWWLLSWRRPASDGPGGSVRLPGDGRRLAHASAAALTSSTWVARRERDRLKVARLTGLSRRSNAAASTPSQSPAPAQVRGSHDDFARLAL